RVEVPEAARVVLAAADIELHLGRSRHAECAHDRHAEHDARRPAEKNTARPEPVEERARTLMVRRAHHQRVRSATHTHNRFSYCLTSTPTIGAVMTGRRAAGGWPTTTSTCATSLPARSVSVATPSTPVTIFTAAVRLPAGTLTAPFAAATAGSDDVIVI